MSNNKIKTFLVDDSAISRGIFEKAFKESDKFLLVGSASNGRKAIDYCKEHPVDLVISDYDMPEMNGIEATKIITGELNIPVCIYSETAAIKESAMNAGAIYFSVKPSFSSFSSKTMDSFISSLYDAIKNSVHDSPVETKNTESSDFETINRKSRKFKILCIGASTGGPTAVEEVLKNLGKNFPLPILYVQHIDVGADSKMVAWFNSCCPNTPMHLAKDGEIAKNGHVYMAPADTHLVIDYVNENGSPVLKLSDEPPERFLKPAVNKLFRSAANLYKKECLAILMTGMGRDGAEGCEKIVENGGFTIAEDKSTCAVFGMPAAAIELNSAKMVLPRNQIAKQILLLV